jgi:predicted porin
MLHRWAEAFPIKASDYQDTQEVQDNASRIGVAGTDGGPTGTGRADRVVQYRNTALNFLEIGVQGQFRGDSTGTSSEGIGGSVQIKILPGVKVGGAYTRTNWPLAKQQEIQGLGASYSSCVQRKRN